MRILRVISLTLKEYHKRKYIYYLLLFCIIPTAILNVRYQEKSNSVDYVVNGIEADINFFVVFAVILLGMQTYSPRLKSDSIVLEVTKPVKRMDYYLGKLIANLIVALLCAGGIVLFSVFLVLNHGVTLLILQKACVAFITPLFFLSAVSVINLYLPTKATGISGFVLYLIYNGGVNYMEENHIKSQVTIMGFTASIVTISILFVSIALIIMGTLIFNHKEL